MRKKVAVTVATAAMSVTFGLVSRSNAQTFIDNFDNGVVANSDTIPNFWTTGTYSPGDASSITEPVGGPLTMNYNGALTNTGSVPGGPHMNGPVSNEFNFWQHPVDVTLTAAPGGTLVPGTDDSQASLAETYISLEAQTGRSDYGANRFVLQLDDQNALLFAIKDQNNLTKYNYTIYNYNAWENYPVGGNYGPNILVTSMFLYLDGTQESTDHLFVNFGETWVNTTNNQTGSFNFQTALNISTPYDLGPAGGYPNLSQSTLDGMKAPFASGASLGTEVLNTQNNYYSNEAVPYGQITDIPTETWNNSGAVVLPADGATWDAGVNGNWVNPNTITNTDPNATYTDGYAVQFTDQNNNNYAVTLNTTVHPGSILFSNSAGTYTVSGTGSIAGSGSLTKSGTGRVILSTANTFSGGTTVNGGILEIAPTATPATTSALGTGPLTINNSLVKLDTNVTLGSQPTSTPASSVTMTSLAVNGTGQLDITNNHILINYGTGTDPIASIAALIQSGYASGAWTGPGIISSTAAANAASYGIGYADAADSGNPAGLATGQIEVKYTLLGDANLDGKVNSIDFAILASNFNKAVTGSSGWDEGDFNYSGNVNSIDFAALAGNFNKGASQADVSALEAFASANGLLADVPEPATLGLMLVGAAGLMSRRRRAN